MEHVVFAWPNYVSAPTDATASKSVWNDNIYYNLNTGNYKTKVKIYFILLSLADCYFLRLTFVMTGPTEDQFPLFRHSVATICGEGEKTK